MEFHQNFSRILIEIVNFSRIIPKMFIPRIFLEISFSLRKQELLLIFPKKIPETSPETFPETSTEIFTGKFPGIVETLFVGAEEGGTTSTNPFKNSG